MKFIQATIAAALVAAASAGSVRRDTENSVHVRVVKVGARQYSCALFSGHT
jgi:hypothetical protein